VKLTRRSLAGFLGFLPGLFARPAESCNKITPKRRWPVPPSFWYENDSGDQWIPDFETGINALLQPPIGFKYQWFCAPNNLHTSVSSPSGRLATMNNHWPEDLVLAMANDGYRLSEAILIVCNMCERCLNATAYDYKLRWGYERDSDQWKSSGVFCRFCKPGTVRPSTGIPAALKGRQPGMTMLAEQELARAKGIANAIAGLWMEG
jgi:hypothetical protein